MSARRLLLLFFLLLPAESLLGSLVGGRIVLLATLGPVLAFAYWVLAVQLWFSSRFRSDLRGFVETLQGRRAGLVIWCICAGLLLLSILRGGAAGSIDTSRSLTEFAKWSATFLVMLCAAVEGVRDDDPAPLLRPLLLSLSAHLVINVMLVAFGIRNGVLDAQVISPPEEGVLLRLIGIPWTRIALPLGMGTGGIQVAVGIAAGFALYWVKEWSQARIAAVLLMGGALFCVLVTDSRGGMLAAILALGIAMLPPWGLRRSPWLPLIVVVLPALLLIGLAALGDGGSLESVSREGEASVGILSGRPLIWGAIATFLLEWHPQMLVGWGAVGQIASGVNPRYAFLFSGSYASTDSIGAHNSILQGILEVGVLGTVLILLLAGAALRAFSARAGTAGPLAAWARVGIACVSCVLLLGMTDSTLSINTFITLVLFMGATLEAMVIHRTVR